MRMWCAGEKIDLLSMNEEELAALCAEKGWPAFRARQLFLRLGRFPQKFDEFTELPKEARLALSETHALPALSLVRKQQAKDKTAKYLFSLWDGQLVESVFMEYRYGTSLCISTQVGCAMGCVFCASGQGGFVRHLNPSEMLGQVYMAAKDANKRVDRVVLMGTGEPLHNLEAVVRFIELAGKESGLSIGQRNITLSTSGLCGQIDALAAYQLGITLSISLHSAFDDVRNRLMPVNRQWNVETLVQTAENYQKTTKRRVSYEYAMIHQINDRPEDVAALTKLLRGKGAHINLIRLNKIAESPLLPSSEAREKAFVQALSHNGLHVTVRRSLGQEIDGACGQLRHRTEKRRIPNGRRTGGFSE